MALMRAKMRVVGVKKHDNVDQEDLTFTAVGPGEAYPEDGSDENNSYARWTPMADLTMSVQNPALFGKLKVNDEVYLDFTVTDKQEVTS
jgi:hypothetical protein